MLLLWCIKGVNVHVCRNQSRLHPEAPVSSLIRILGYVVPATVPVISTAIIGLTWWGYEHFYFANKRDFDRTLWLQAENCDRCDLECLRGGMLHDLRKRYLKLETTMADVM